MSVNKTEDVLQEGTTINNCMGCGMEYVILEEFSTLSRYCTPACKEENSLLNQAK